MKQKALRLDAHSAQRWMVAKATAPRRENVPRHILSCKKLLPHAQRINGSVKKHRYVKEYCIAGKTSAVLY